MVMDIRDEIADENAYSVDAALGQSVEHGCHLCLGPGFRKLQSLFVEIRIQKVSWFGSVALLRFQEAWESHLTRETQVHLYHAAHTRRCISPTNGDR